MRCSASVKPSPFRMAEARPSAGKPRLDVGDPGRVGGGFGFRDQRRAFGIRRQYRVEKRDLVPRHLLRDAADLRLLRQGDRAGVEHQFAADQLEQGGLARPVAPHDADLVAFGNRDRGVLDQGTPGDGIGDVLNTQHARAIAEAGEGGQRERGAAPVAGWRQVRRRRGRCPRRRMATVGKGQGGAAPVLRTPPGYFQQDEAGA